MKIAAFVPAKGTSDRIDNKNVKPLDGKPLFLHTIDKLLACDFIDEVVLDTDSEHIIALAGDRSCKVLRRDPALATNKTDGNALYLNQVRNTDADIVVQVLGTSPFIEPATIARGIDIALPRFAGGRLVRHGGGGRRCGNRLDAACQAGALPCQRARIGELPVLGAPDSRRDAAPLY